MWLARNFELIFFIVFGGVSLSEFFKGHVVRGVLALVVCVVFTASHYHILAHNFCDLTSLCVNRTAASIQPGTPPPHPPIPPGSTALDDLEALRKKVADYGDELKRIAAERSAAAANAEQLANELKAVKQWVTEQRDAAASNVAAHQSYCDANAAAFWDTDLPATTAGVEFDGMTAAATDVALSCEIAVNADPNNRRLIFQLGRVRDRQGNYRAAMTMYVKASELGSGAAFVNLGVLFAKGQGVARDRTKACSLYAEGGKRENAEGAFLYANCLASGDGAVKDPTLARQWYAYSLSRGLRNPVRVDDALRRL